MKADKQVSSFRRKGTLPFLLIVGKNDFKKGLLPWSYQDQKEILKPRKPEQPSPAVVP